MNESPLPVAPRKKGLGCFATGCLGIVILVLVTVVALFVGTFFGVLFLKDKYLAKAPVPLPQVEVTPEQVQEVQQRWAHFEASAKARPNEPSAQPRQKDRLELSASDINALIAGNRRARGKVFVSIENNIAQVQTSFPLDGVRGLSGRYLNANAAIASNGGTVGDANFHGIILNNNAVPDGILDWQYRGRSFRSYVEGYAGQYDIGSMKIENNMVVLETRD